MKFFNLSTSILLTLPVIITATTVHANIIQQQELPVPDKKSKVTTFIISYFETLASKNLMQEQDLQRLLKQETIINPISETAAGASHEAFIYRKQFKNILEKNISQPDLETIKSWAATKLEQLREYTTVRDEVKEKTRPVYIPMSFVSLPKGIYKNPLDDHAITISEGIEIQDTLVTQYQWTTVMGENLAFFTEGPDSEEIVINNQKIRMHGNAPVENMSYEQVQEFLKRLNEEDKEYWYELPSVGEFCALLQLCLGNSWISNLGDLLEEYSEKTPGIVQSGDYLEYDKQRVWDIIGTLWQWTRDSVKLPLKTGEECTARLVFGTSYTTNKTGITDLAGLLRPIMYGESKHKKVGLRLVRYPKNRVEHCTLYTYQELSWDQSISEHDSEWEWNELFDVPLLFDDGLQWMIDHKEQYSHNIQHTLTVLINDALEQVKNEKIVNYLKQKKHFRLDHSDIHDIAPLKYLINLEELYLGKNQISDIAGLNNLINLKTLYLEHNKIQDITLLKDLINLSSLNLISNQINNIGALKELINLKELHLESNKVQDLEPLKDLVNLWKLNLGDNQISDIGALKELTKLIVLWLSGNLISDIKELRKLVNLKILYLENNKIQDITPLKDLVNITMLWLNDNQINDVTVLLSLANLHSIYLTDSQIEDQAVLDKLRQKGVQIND